MSNLPPYTPPPPQQPPPLYPGYTPAPLQEANGKKTAAGICAILLGQLGVHKFILGYTGAGITMLLVTLLTCGLGGIAMHVIGIIEGITYLTKTDQEFYNTYMIGRKEWF
jgi:TM2 domain-containing membrane protein YozV